MKPYTLDEAEAEARAAIDAGDPARITAMEKIVDQLDTHKPPVSLHAAALYYAEQGLHVFPLSPGSKIPFKGSGGCLDATNDTTMINKWWEGNTRANIGIATGHLVDVIDIDGPLGVKSWLDVRDDLPATIGKVTTPRPGGAHLYVPAVEGRSNKAGILPGIDYRGTGGYVVAPPSRITGGDHPGVYAWMQPLQLAALAGAA